MSTFGYAIGRLKFARKVEADFWEVGLRHLEHIARIGKEHVTALAVDCHKLMLPTLECLKGIGIVALNPACLGEMYRLPAALSAILMQEAILYYFKLQLPQLRGNRLYAYENVSPRRFSDGGEPRSVER